MTFSVPQCHKDVIKFEGFKNLNIRGRIHVESMFKEWSLYEYSSLILYVQ